MVSKAAVGVKDGAVVFAAAYGCPSGGNGDAEGVGGAVVNAVAAGKPTASHAEWPCVAVFAEVVEQPVEAPESSIYSNVAIAAIVNGDAEGVV